jgi:hypothetical protein
MEPSGTGTNTFLRPGQQTFRRRDYIHRWKEIDAQLRARTPANARNSKRLLHLGVAPTKAISDVSGGISDR